MVNYGINLQGAIKKKKFTTPPSHPPLTHHGTIIFFSSLHFEGRYTVLTPGPSPTLVPGGGITDSALQFFSLQHLGGGVKQSLRLWSGALKCFWNQDQQCEILYLISPNSISVFHGHPANQEHKEITHTMIASNTL